MSQPKRLEAVPTPERISVDELAYHTVVNRQVKAAEAARDSWTGYLARKYRLKIGDSISTLDGAIVRQPETGSGMEGA